MIMIIIIIVTYISTLVTKAYQTPRDRHLLKSCGLTDIMIIEVNDLETHQSHKKSVSVARYTVADHDSTAGITGTEVEARVGVAACDSYWYIYQVHVLVHIVWIP